MLWGLAGLCRAFEDIRQPAGIAGLDRQKHQCGHRGYDGAAAGPKSRNHTAENTNELAALHARPPEGHHSGSDGYRKRLGTSVPGVRRAKAALSSGCKSYPAIAPAGSNRSSHGGNEVAEAFDYPVGRIGAEGVIRHLAGWVEPLRNPSHVAITRSILFSTAISRLSL